MSSPAPGTPPPPPEAALIRLAREAQAVSPETAAAAMPFRFSGSSWRQIEAGFRGRARTPVVAKASILAHMARVVGVTAERLEEAGRADAAAVMQEIEAQGAGREVVERQPLRPPSLPGEARERLLDVALEGLTPDEAEELLEEELRRRRAASREQEERTPGRGRRYGA